MGFSLQKSLENPNGGFLTLWVSVSPLQKSYIFCVWGGGGGEGFSRSELLRASAVPTTSVWYL